MQDFRKSVILQSQITLFPCEVVGTKVTNRPSNPYFPIRLAGLMGFFVPFYFIFSSVHIFISCPPH